jgi:AcrR family transcriptional regulator
MNQDATGPRRRPKLDPAVVISFRRARITQALAELCSEKGFRATTISDIAARARVSRKTIYDNFDNSEAIFCELLEASLASLFERTQAACSAEPGDGLEQVDAALTAVVTWVAMEPSAARIWLVEAGTAGERSRQLQLKALARFTDLLRRYTPPDTRRPTVVDEMVVGGVESILRYLIVAGETERAGRVLPGLIDFLRQPYLRDPDGLGFGG